MGRGEDQAGISEAAAARLRGSERPSVYELLPEGWSAPQIFWESSVECLEPETAISARNSAGIYSQLPELLYELSKEQRLAYLDLLEDKLCYWAEQLSETGSGELSAEDRQRAAAMLNSAIGELFAEMRVSS